MTFFGNSRGTRDSCGIHVKQESNIYPSRDWDRTGIIFHGSGQEREGLNRMIIVLNVGYFKPFIRIFAPWVHDCESCAFSLTPAGGPRIAYTACPTMSMRQWECAIKTVLNVIWMLNSMLAIIEELLSPWQTDQRKNNRLAWHQSKRARLI